MAELREGGSRGSLADRKAWDRAGAGWLVAEERPDGGHSVCEERQLQVNDSAAPRWGLGFTWGTAGRQAG
ncbi:hypothetical protein G6F59_018392 [Rhizopus arrhizus]|nr:hypothetical protein G6F24_017122 [Rhizopus arrhizus]KAG0891667.1 hypothetical protein G6F32_017491 [Rhizopus arrhizus]KAG1374622.1 hypothetical protein G6F59_018392 [Rhizopus arrhizus]